MDRAVALEPPRHQDHHRHHEHPDDTDTTDPYTTDTDDTDTTDPYTTTDTDTETIPMDTGLPDGCGDLSCDAGETCQLCPVDCGSCPATCASDGVCDASAGETCTSCGDCDTTAPVCGNGACDPGEHTVNCMADCGPVPGPTPGPPTNKKSSSPSTPSAPPAPTARAAPKGPVSALTMDPVLQAAARLHSWDQSYSDYFEHDSCNGREPWDRAPLRPIREHRLGTTGAPRTPSTAG